MSFESITLRCPWGALKHVNAHMTLSPTAPFLAIMSEERAADDQAPRPRSKLERSIEEATGTGTFGLSKNFPQGQGQWNLQSPELRLFPESADQGLSRSPSRTVASIAVSSIAR